LFSKGFEAISLITQISLTYSYCNRVEQLNVTFLSFFAVMRPKAININWKKSVSFSAFHILLSHGIGPCGEYYMLDFLYHIYVPNVFLI